MPGTINWAGGEHAFRLNLGELRALQTNCDAGPEEVFNRLRLGTWRVDDVIEPIRLGLIGSGAMSKEQAGRTVTTLMEQRPVAELKLTAIAALAQALLGVGDDPVGESEGAEAGAPENGDSPASTETAQ